MSAITFEMWGFEDLTPKFYPPYIKRKRAKQAKT